MKHTIEGECFRLHLDWTPGMAEPLPLVTLEIEDDGNWFEKTSFSGAWLGELIRLCREAQKLSAMGRKKK